MLCGHANNACKKKCAGSGGRGGIPCPGTEENGLRAWENFKADEAKPHGALVDVSAERRKVQWKENP
eukprot:7992614-Heterocapsa_arctica.AAC.1